MLRKNIRGMKWGQGDALHRTEPWPAPRVVANTWHETHKERSGHERKNVPGEQSAGAKVLRGTHLRYVVSGKGDGSTCPEPINGRKGAAEVSRRGRRRAGLCVYWLTFVLLYSFHCCSPTMSLSGGNQLIKTDLL